MSVVERLKSLDPVIVAFTAGLVVFGVIMLMSASTAVALQRTGDSWYYVKHQILVGILPGILLFLALALIDYRAWKPFSFLALLASLGLLVMVFLPGLGQTVNGARGWVKLGAIQFQPSELVKLTFLFYLSAWLASRQAADAHDLQTGLLPFLGAIGSVMLLLILEPDTGSMAIVVGTSLILYFIAGAPITWFAGLCAAGVGLVGLLVKLSPYRAARFMIFLHPELDPKGIGYHINQAMLAVGSGGLWGLGYGHSRQKFLYLPEVESDSISAVIAEEMGFIVMVLLISAFAYLVWRCFTIARESRDPFGSFLAAGVGSWLALQFLINVASMTGLMPVTGVTLPFISNGGSAMTVMLGAMGLVAGIPRASSRRV